MATPRDIRTLALLALFQLDQRGEDDVPTITQWLLDAARADAEDDDAAEERSLRLSKRVDDGAIDAAMELARAAYSARAGADDEVRRLAPAWPTHRQPAVDRCILRLAHAEIVKGEAPAKVVINECIELAKRFSTDKSSAFVNGVLDKIMRAHAAAPTPPGGEG